MRDRECPGSGIKSPSAVRRKPISASQAGLIKSECLLPDSALPLVVEPSITGVNLIEWARNNRDFLEAKLLTHGAILFRNFNLVSVAEFEHFIEAISPGLLEYSYRSTPRSHVSGKIYTSTEYPAHQFIPLHNEMAYSRSWPMKISFFCVETPEQGGETPIADSRKIFERIAPEIREKFTQKKLMYVRNYGDGLDLSWQDVFQTADKTEVERFCLENSIEVKWTRDDRLATRQICQATATHPKTGEKVWFNQAHLFHVSSLSPDIADSLLSTFQEVDLPRNVYYGDGSAIESSVLDEIREIYRQESVTFQWLPGDILMLDNMLAAHGRNPYVGRRKIVVGMAEQLAGGDI